MSFISKISPLVGLILLSVCQTNCSHEHSSNDGECYGTERIKGDRDGDGLTDKEEREGWDVIITFADGSSTKKRVRSNPKKCDSNNDGVCDVEARMYGLDPNSRDTDNDGLSDYDEIKLWSSNPLNQDSDGDSNGNPLLFDGSEVNNYFTSPVMEDSDGDGFNDHFEIIQLNEKFSPVIANVPEVEVSMVGSMNLQLDYKYTGSRETAEERSVDLEQSKTSELSSTDSRTHEVTAEVSASVSVKAEAKAFPPGASASAEATASVSAGYSYTNNKTISESSAASSRQLYGKVSSNSTKSGWETKDAKLTTAFVLKNTSNIAYTIKDISVIAILRDPKNPTEFKPLGELSLGEGIESSNSTSLSPGQESGKLAFSIKLPHIAAMNILKNPEMLFFEVSRMELVRSSQGEKNEINMAYLEEITGAKTAQIVVDFGQGHVINERVATNTKRIGGEVKGMLLADVLDKMLNLDYSISKNEDLGIDVLNSIVIPDLGTEISNNFDKFSFWAVVGSNGMRVPLNTNFSDLVISAGNTVHLVFVKDEDKDGLFKREEMLYGTYDNQEEAEANGVLDSTDCDGDGVSDGDEVKLGWEIGELILPSSKKNPYKDGSRVFSDPSNADADGDGLNDSEEMRIGTDPNKQDTDLDSRNDSEKKPLEYNPGTA